MGCTSIKESEVASVERFGKYDRIIGSGCHFYNCCTESVRHHTSLRLQSSNLTLETVTKESLSITIKVGIQYKVNDENLKFDSNEIELDRDVDGKIAYY